MRGRLGQRLRGNNEIVCAAIHGWLSRSWPVRGCVVVADGTFSPDRMGGSKVCEGVNHGVVSDKTNNPRG